MHATRKILVGVGTAALLATAGMSGSAAHGAAGAKPAQNGHASVSADTTVADMGAPPEATTSRGVVGVKAGMCPGSPWNKRAKAIKSKVTLKKDYYNASPTVVTLSYGTTMGYYDYETNSHGNLWHRVQYSNIQNDWCGWVSDNWVELYYP